MAITDIIRKRQANRTVVRVVSDLESPVYFHWYLDGQYRGMSLNPEWAFALPVGGRARVAVVDTTDPDYDGAGNCPDASGAYLPLEWRRSLADDVGHYRIEESVDGGDYVAVAEVLPEPNVWSYEHAVGPLTDLATYTWKVIPVDLDGND